MIQKVGEKREGQNTGKRPLDPLTCPSPEGNPLPFCSWAGIQSLPFSRGKRTGNRDLFGLAWFRISAHLYYPGLSQVVPVVKNQPANARNTG